MLSGSEKYHDKLCSAMSKDDARADGKVQVPFILGRFQPKPL